MSQSGSLAVSTPGDFTTGHGRILVLRYLVTCWVPLEFCNSAKAELTLRAETPVRGVLVRGMRCEELREPMHCPVLVHRRWLGA